MPPQSRGAASRQSSFPSPESFNPTLKPFLDNLPNPSSLAAGQITPTAVDSAIEDDLSTPMQPRFKQNEKDGDNLDEEDDEDDDTLDDDEFESHYSRQDSPVSTSEDEDGSEDDGPSETDGQTAPAKFSTLGTIDPLQRISSLPTSFNTTSHLHTSHSTTSLRHHLHHHHLQFAPPIPPPLYPPFYNRPPTPLPPSPSLTSLLRPPSLLNRSTTSTRPTTPDYSDPEDGLGTPNDTEAAVAHSARRATIVPSTAPKVPTYEYYGFVLCLASSLAFLLYLMWSYLPSPILHRVGITYYPNRWWSLAIPAWIVIALIYIYVALACWNIEYLTLGLQRVESMVDDAGNVAILDDMGRLIKGGSKRFETELENELRRRREKGKGHGGHGGSWGRKGGKSGHKKRDRSRREKEREKKEEGGRFGYMGNMFDGRVANGLTWAQIWNEGTDAVMDVPIGGVCEVLYGDGADL